MARMVLLEHELPDGIRHYDWMVERVEEGSGASGTELGTGDNPDERCLITFRVGERIDGDGCRGFLARRIGDHRRAYLDYEGPVPGGRGWVKRVAAGRVAIRRSDPTTVIVVGRFAAGPDREWIGVPGLTEGDWMFKRVSGA